MRLRSAPAAAAVLLCALGSARAAETPAVLVATRDPALFSALDAAFAPRGVRVAFADQRLRATSDQLATSAPAADVVWLCDVTPVPAPASSPGGAATAAGGTALCVRPHQGTVIVRRIAVATPLSPEDAAALALSVQVALMPDAAPPTVARPTAAPAPADAPAVDLSGTHTMTLELSLGVFHDRSDETFAHPSVALTYMPWLGIDWGSASPSARCTVTSVGLVPARRISYENDLTDMTVRLFARRQARTGPIWLQLDLGPEAHIES